MANFQDGGSFPTKVWSKAQDRLGTAETGHLRKYIATDFYYITHGPKYNPAYAASLDSNRMEYHLKKSPLTPFAETYPETHLMQRVGNKFEK